MKYAMRRVARRYALQVLYSMDINPETEEASLDAAVTEKDKLKSTDLSFAESLIQRVRDNLPAIDEEIQKHLRKWSLSQLNGVDRNILRIAAAELLFPGDEKPEKGTIINEAVIMAKIFAGDTSYRFINGVLNTIAEEHQL